MSTKRFLVRLLEIDEVDEPPKPKSNEVWQMSFVTIPSPPPLSI